jgi:hypothetical protein
VHLPRSVLIVCICGFPRQRYNCHPPGQLRQIRPVAAFLLVRRNAQRTSLNLLWATTGALADIVWRTIPDGTKQQLRKDTAFE